MTRRVLSAAGYIVKNMITYIVYLIVRRKTFQHDYLSVIPLASNVLLCLISIYYPVIFRFNYMNVFMRGSLYFYPFFINLVYLLMTLAFSIRLHSRQRTMEVVIFVLLILQIVLALFLGLQPVYQDLYLLVMPVSLIFYYMYLHSLQYKVDSLTGMLNRNCYDIDIKRFERKEHVAVIVADVNRLKEINDTYGHPAGDIALKMVGSVLQKHLPISAMIYRLGGDEFVVLWQNAGISQVENAISKICHILESLWYSVSFGYQIHHKSQGQLHDAIIQADQMMYENKK